MGICLMIFLLQFLGGILWRRPFSLHCLIVSCVVWVGPRSSSWERPHFLYTYKNSFPSDSCIPLSLLPKLHRDQMLGYLCSRLLCTLLTCTSTYIRSHRKNPFMSIPYVFQLYCPKHGIWFTSVARHRTAAGNMDTGCHLCLTSQERLWGNTQRTPSFFAPLASYTETVNRLFWVHCSARSPF